MKSYKNTSNLLLAIYEVKMLIDAKQNASKKRNVYCAVYEN